LAGRPEKSLRAGAARRLSTWDPLAGERELAGGSFRSINVVKVVRVGFSAKVQRPAAACARRRMPVQPVARAPMVDRRRVRP